MRFSLFTAACMAPLALAGSLQSGLAARGIKDAMEVQARTDGMSGQQGAQGADQNNKGGQQNDQQQQDAQKQDQQKNDNQKNKNNGNTGNAQVINVVQNSSPQVIVLWVNNGGGAATETITQTVTTTIGGQATASVVATAPGTGTTHQVMVGGTAGLVYVPDQIVAKIGDAVEFTFMAANHTVTQSTFDLPCKKLAGGMDTGFISNPNNTVNPPPKMAMQVTVDTPIWFYCRQASHCGKGMAFSINPTAAKTQAQFQALAIAQNGTGTLAPIQGGAPAGGAAGTPPPPPAAAAPPPPAGTTVAAPGGGASMAAGSGTLVGGQCACSCLCGAGTFPAANVQGVGAVGGMPGSIPMSAMEKIA